MRNGFVFVIGEQQQAGVFRRYRALPHHERDVFLQGFVEIKPHHHHWETVYLFGLDQRQGLNNSSMVPKPPGKITKAYEYFTNNTLRTKK